MLPLSLSLSLSRPSRSRAGAGSRARFDECRAGPPGPCIAGSVDRARIAAGIECLWRASASVRLGCSPPLSPLSAHTKKNHTASSALLAAVASATLLLSGVPQVEAKVILEQPALKKVRLIGPRTARARDPDRLPC